jgi:hypothetical protein
LQKADHGRRHREVQQDEAAAEEDSEDYIQEKERT